MTTGTVLKWGGLAAITFWIINSMGLGAIASTLNYYIKGIGFSNGAVTINLAVQNPRSAGFIVNSLFGNITVGGSQIGNLSLQTPIEVPPNAEIILPLTVRISVFDILFNAQEFIQGAINAKSPVVFSGNVNVNGTVIPLTLKYNA